MLELFIVTVRGLALALCGHQELVLENLALRQQLMAMKRTTKRVSLATRDRHLSTDHDPLFEAHRWTANLRILEIDGIKTGPHVPCHTPAWSA